jgi:hypothetical protein
MRGSVRLRIHHTKSSGALESAADDWKRSTSSSLSRLCGRVCIILLTRAQFLQKKGATHGFKMGPLRNINPGRRLRRCARPASGQAAAAPPSSVMNSRRLKLNNAASLPDQDNGCVSSRATINLP